MCRCTDSYGKNKAFTRPDYGAACMYRHCHGCAGLYKPIIDFAGAGATVPLTGFGYTLWMGVKDAIDNEGFLGIFKGGFGASAIGISASLLLGFIAAVIFKPKTKK